MKVKFKLSISFLSLTHAFIWNIYTSINLFPIAHDLNHAQMMILKNIPQSIGHNIYQYM